MCSSEDRKDRREAADKQPKHKCDDDETDCPLAHLKVVVKTSAGQPVPLADVKLLKGGSEVQSGKTDDKGEHDFGKIEAGTYTVTATKDCFKPKEAKKDVTLAEGDDKAVELTLDPYDIKIKAKKASYTVVLDKSGNEVAAHPILEFEISDGPPDHKFDVQLSRDSANGLSGGPGLAGAWDKSKDRDDRVGKKLYSSWSNGETSLKLDGSGKATYKMPLEWWRDLARIKLADFDKKDFYYRVIALDASSKPCARSSPDGGAGAPKVEVKNNLVQFKAIDQGYVNGGHTKHERVEFTVREADTTEMYTVVQWLTGSNRVWGGGHTHANLFHYGKTHKADCPTAMIDSSSTNPRPNFFGGAAGPSVTADKKTAYGVDPPGGPIGGSDTHDFFSLDFESHVHLNFEVPASVTISKQTGSAPVYDELVGVMADPQPVTLDSATWHARILQIQKPDGTIDITHPNTYAGP